MRSLLRLAGLALVALAILTVLNAVNPVPVDPPRGPVAELTSEKIQARLDDLGFDNNLPDPTHAVWGHCWDPSLWQQNDVAK